MTRANPEKNYRWEAHYFCGIDTGVITGIGSIVRQTVKATDPSQALRKILDNVGIENVDIVKVSTPFGAPVARYLSREAATIEACVDSNLSYGDFPSNHEKITFNDDRIVIDGLKILYHRPRMEIVQRVNKS